MGARSTAFERRGEPFPVTPLASPLNRASRAPYPACWRPSKRNIRAVQVQFGCSAADWRPVRYQCILQGRPSRCAPVSDRSLILQRFEGVVEIILSHLDLLNPAPCISSCLKRWCTVMRAKRTPPPPKMRPQTLDVSSLQHRSQLIYVFHY